MWMDLLEIKQFLPAAPKRDSAERVAERIKLNTLDRQSFVILGDPTVALPPFAS
jgi:hypothetical protein